MTKGKSGRSGFWGSEEPAEEPANYPSPIVSGADSAVTTADTGAPQPDLPQQGSAGDGSASGEGSAAAEEPVREDLTTQEPAAAGPSATASAASKPAHKNRVRSILELPILIGIAIAVAIILKTFVIQPFYIPSESMEQTLYGCAGCSGDRILVFKPVYKLRDPHPGDIVVFKAPEDWDEGDGTIPAHNPLVRAVQWFGQLVGVVPPSERDLVKRVIAVGGQTVKCCDDQGNVQVSDNGPNGPWRSLDETYIYQPSPWSPPSTPGSHAPGDQRSFGPVTVPKGRLWVMGDHRSDSADSRYHCGTGGVYADCDPIQSTVPVSQVIGKAVVIAWPPSRWRTLGTPKTFEAVGVEGYSAVTTTPAPAAAGAGLFALAIVVGRDRSRRRRRRHHNDDADPPT
jgi:signal peptidase I